jgi:SAM-dependent methyltransferase
MAFFNSVSPPLDPSFVVLDAACGRGEYHENEGAIRWNLRIWQRKVARVVGIDLDPNAAAYPYLDEFRLIEGDSWSIASDSADLIVCGNTPEHMEKPEGFFSEVWRVLKNGAYLCT